VRGREVATRGWTRGSGVDWPDALARLEASGAEAVVVTQIQGEGALGGPDLAGLAEVVSATELAVIASGGVGTLDDLRALAAIDAEGRGLAGVIVGTAIYDRRFDVHEAVSACAR
jgi:phosphoribosylformimino-5-aminoimidazole carboxamide ribonucleotide (ProFAR) isomerase